MRHKVHKMEQVQLLLANVMPSTLLHAIQIENYRPFRKHFFNLSSQSHCLMIYNAMVVFI